MKIINKIIILFVITFGIFSITSTEVLASKYGDTGKVEGLNSIGGKYQKLTNEKDFGEAATDVGYKILNWARLVFSGVLIILIIYAGAQMVMSTGTDDDQLGKSRRAILYSIVGLIFINFPLEIYQSLYAENKGSNLFIYQEGFKLLLGRILTAIEILIGGLAVFLIVLEGIKLIANGGDEESFTKARKRLVWVVGALIFLGFIHLWILFLESGDLNKSTGLFQAVGNLALYIAGPIALFFLCLAGYYYIFSNGDEDKVKKGKNIIINTCIGVIILICVYVLLNDLSLLKF
ncbi:hypothetical protein BKN14_03605 [Candidatus Gracilibacteria bacterium HOT-871]|nr:hypothetical protein BKN14_03605 [Candidatus Gracilibacteria bacterium HOT-871]MBB1564745.1 hypothetical protein [Candidatus Gracilibacteria bacterium]RKW23251.1 MAG: hypothetical protein D8B46_03655 [Candidatus Gracilibacteria bacterium]